MATAPKKTTPKKGDVSSKAPKKTTPRKHYATRATVDKSMSTTDLPSRNDEDYASWTFERLVEFEAAVQRDEKIMPELAAAQLALFREYRTGNPRKGLNDAKHKEYWPRVKILRSDLQGGDKPVKIAVNLLSASFEREKESTIRPCFLEALVCAVQTNYREEGVDDSTGKPILLAYDSPSYPFSILKPCTFPDELLYLAGLDIQPGELRPPQEDAEAA